LAKATWKEVVIAESDEVIEVEGNLYFPPNSVKAEYFKRSEREYTCPWKGQAGYYDIVVEGETYKDAAWFYYEPSEAAMKIKDYVAFDRGVTVEGTASSRLTHP
jgi:uncharacterized protein (DUF427 family)